MGIRELIEKFKGKQEEEEDYEAKPVIDRYLDSLRRERQTQMNEQEKIRLKQTIADYKRAQMREGLYGIGEKRDDNSYLGKVKDKKVEVLNTKKKILKQKNILQQQSILKNKTLLDNKKREFKEKKRNYFV